MTIFELYDLNELKETESVSQEDKTKKLQEMIDERLKMHSLVSQVVDQKLAQRDAIEMLIRERISRSLPKEAKEEVEKEEPSVEIVQEADTKNLM